MNSFPTNTLWFTELFVIWKFPKLYSSQLQSPLHEGQWTTWAAGRKFKEEIPGDIHKFVTTTTENGMVNKWSQDRQTQQSENYVNTGELYANESEHPQ